jgi:hypothetical protein
VLELLFGSSETAGMHIDTADVEPECTPYHAPILGMEAHGSCLGLGAPFCTSSIEILSGERTNASLPSRGGRLMGTPDVISVSQIA